MRRLSQNCTLEAAAGRVFFLNFGVQDGYKGLVKYVLQALPRERGALHVTLAV